MPEQRLDKWLWCTRLVKTRSFGSRLIASGRVRINGERALKPSRQLRSGDVVTGAYLGRLFVVRVTGPAERRVSATIARTLYEDLTPEIGPSGVSAQAARRGKRPTKRDRRRIDALKREEL